MRAAAIVLCLLLTACAGYRLGGAKPASLSGIQSIAIPMALNETLHPRVSAIATSAAADALVRDGTYLLRSPDEADAVLKIFIEEITYNQLRSTRIDTLRPAELETDVELRWELRESGDPTRILARGESSGSSSFFVASNLQTARDNALPDAFERASGSMIANLADGF